MNEYNIATDCVDKHLQFLQTKDQVALSVVEAIDGVLRHKSLTFSNLAGLTNRFANALQGQGVQLGERLLIRLPNSAEFPIVFLGAIKAGIIPIPTSPLLTWNELEFLLNDSEATVLVTTAELLPQELYDAPNKLKIITVGATGILIFKDLIKNAPSKFEVVPTQADDPAYWLYTSGTEGTPKAVIHAHRSIPAHDERVKLWQDLQFNDVVFNTSALNWSYALTAGLLDCWRHRVHIVTYDGPPAADLLCQLISKYKVTVLMSVPGIYRRLVRLLQGEAQQAAPLQTVRVALSAGEALSQEVRDQFRESCGLEIYEGLGMTEHSVYLVQRFGEELVPGSCGQPLPGTRVEILRQGRGASRSAPTDVGEIGILATHRSCPGLMSGYRDEPTPCSGEWFLSGDLAKRDEAGNFYFVGRRDDIMTVGGYRVSPLEVEAVLNECPLVAESGAVVQRQAGKTVMVAFIVLSDVGAGLPRPGAGTAPLQDAVLAHARERLATYKVPRQVFVLEALPRTRNGKLKREALRGI